MKDSARLSDAAKRAVRERYRPALIVLTGGTVGERVSLHGNAVLGRDPDAELVLSDPGVSWQHALVEDQGDKYVVVDLESTNGTYVNGQRVTEKSLEPGDKLRVGGTTIRFEFQDEADEAFTEAVAHLINIDDLSGLYLRRRFDRELEGLITAARASGTELGLLAMDLDGIKGINDRFGHLFGAYTIAESGKVIGAELHDRGIGCRFGGDEFIAALPGHGLEASLDVAECIRSRIGSHPFEYESVRLHPGISIGVATYPIDAQDAVSLFKDADAALYEAKRTGKNCVRSYRAMADAPADR
jgi:two-component system cell cycle response regulator